MVICLLNDAEMRTLGMNGYLDCMNERGISGLYPQVVFCFCSVAYVEFLRLQPVFPPPCHFVVIQHPIVEGGPPSSMEAFEAVVDRALALLLSGDSVLCHCRGGVGRAGLLASCILLVSGISASPRDAIMLIRKRRFLFPSRYYTCC